MNRTFLISLATILIVIGLIGSFATFNTDTEEVAKKETFSTTDIKRINISSDNVKVDVLPSKESEIKVELTGTQSTQNTKEFETNVKDDTLQVVLKDKRWHIFDFGSFLTSLELRVYVPEKEYEALQVESSNGRITAKGVHVNNIELKTDNGRIDGEDLTASTTNVYTDNGGVSLKNVSGTIATNTANGKIELSTPDLERSIDLKTDNGAIIIHSEQEPKNVSFITSTDNGSIDIFGKYNGGAVIGHGDHTVKLETANGSISVSH